MNKETMARVRVLHPRMEMLLCEMAGLERYLRERFIGTYPEDEMRIARQAVENVCRSLEDTIREAE